MSKPLNFDQIRAMGWREQASAIQEHTDLLVVQAVLVAERTRMPVRPTLIQACEQRLADLGGLPADPSAPVDEVKASEESPSAEEGEAGLSEGPPAESSSAPGASEPAPAPLPPVAPAPMLARAIPVAERTKLIKTCRVFCLVPKVKTIRHGVTTLHLMPGKHLDGVPKVTAEYLASKRLVRIISEA